jgi:membrane protein
VAVAVHQRAPSELRRIARRVLAGISEHDVLTFASAIAFRVFIALVALTLLQLGFLDLVGRKDVWQKHVAPAIEPHVLPAVYSGIEASVQKIFQSGSGGVVTVAALLAIWDVSSSVRACMSALNRLYDAEEARPWWLRFPISFALAVLIIVAVIGSFLLLVAAKGAFHGGAGVAFAVVRWLGSILLLGLAIGVLVRFAPAEPRAKKWATTGTALIVVAWLVTSVVFKWYVTSVANFRTAAGSLAVFLVITSYVYVGAIILLVGIELDELLRKDVQGEDRALHEIVRGLL